LTELDAIMGLLQSTKRRDRATHWKK